MSKNKHIFAFLSESDICSKAVYVIIIMVVGHQQVLETKDYEQRYSCD